jgi:hypothetical protein
MTYPNPTVRFVFAAAWLVLAGLLAGPATSKSHAQTLGKPQVRFGGFYRPSGWLRYEVTIENAAERFEGRLEVVGAGRMIFARQILIPAPFHGQSTVGVLLHAFVPPLHMRLVRNDGTVVTQTPLPLPRPLRPGDVLVGCVGGEERGFPDPEELLGDRRVRSTRFETQDLPSLVEEYAVFDVIILDRGDPQGLDARRLGALCNWVSTGGRLVIADWGLLYGPKPTPLLRAIFPSWTDKGDVDGTALLERWGRWTPDTEAVDALGGSPPDAWFLEDGALLFFHISLGRGRVTVLGLPSSSDSIRSWSFSKSRRFWEKILLDTPAETTRPSPGGLNCIDAKAYDPFLPPHWPQTVFDRVALNGGLYILGILALGLFLLLFSVRKGTVAAAALGAAVVGVFFVQSYALPKGHATAQTLTVAEFLNSEPRCRVEKTVHISSQRGGTLGISLKENAVITPVAYNLHLLTSTPMRFVSQGDKTWVEDLRLPPKVRYCFRTTTEHSDLGRITVTLSRQEGVLSALVASELLHPLREAFLLRMGTAYPLGRLGPGDVRRVDLGAGQMVSTLLHRLDEAGRTDERRILASFVEHHLRPGETVLAGFSDNFPPPRWDTGSFVSKRALPTILFVRAK